MAVQAPIQGTLGATGAAAGDLAARNELGSGSEYFSEFAGEFGTAPIDVAAMAVGGIRDNKSNKRGESVTDAKQKTTPINAEDILGRPQLPDPVAPPAAVLAAETVDDAIAAAQVHISGAPRINATAASVAAPQAITPA